MNKENAITQQQKDEERRENCNDYAADLLCKAAGKPLREIRQFDCHFGIEPWHNNPVGCDEDGDGLCWGAEVDFMNSCNMVRLLIPGGTSKEDTLRGLRKLTEWISGMEWKDENPEDCCRCSGFDPVVILKHALLMAQEAQHKAKVRQGRG